MATLYKRGRVWWAAGRDRHGRVWQRSTKQTDERSAQAVASRLEQELALDAYRAPDQACTLQVAFTSLLTFSRAAGRSEETIEFLETKARHLARVMGADRLCADITPAITSAYAQTRIGEGAHRHTVHKEIRVLTQALRRAAKLRLYKPDTEPRDLKPDEIRDAYQPRDRWLTQKEYELLLAELDPERAGRTRRRRLKKNPERKNVDRAERLGKLSGREKWNEELAREVLFAWARSGEPLRTFARERKINVQRLLWWRDQLGLADELVTISETVQAMHDLREPEEDRRDYVVVMCQTGTRLGELYGIRAEHVDLQRHTLFIAGTKTKKARRTVPITPLVAQVLEARMKRFAPGPLFPEWGKVQRDLYAACLRIERRMNPELQRKVSRKKGGNVPATPVQNPKNNPVPKGERMRPPLPFDPVTPNDLRRTYASWLAQAGVPMLHAMKLMGHGSTQMLERVYAQLAPEHLRDAVALLPASLTARQALVPGDDDE